MRSPVSVSGQVHAVLSEKGRPVYETFGDNLVVDGGLGNIALLLGGNIAASPVTQMRLGAGTNWPSPAGAITTLDNAPLSSPYKNIAGSDTTYPTNPSGQAQVNYRAVWNENEVNSFTIYEVGIFAAGNLLVARYVFANPGIVKSVTQTLAIDYLVTIQSA